MKKTISKYHSFYLPPIKRKSSSPSPLFRQFSRSTRSNTHSAYIRSSKRPTEPFEQNVRNGNGIELKEFEDIPSAPIKFPLLRDGNIVGKNLTIYKVLGPEADILKKAPSIANFPPGITDPVKAAIQDAEKNNRHLYIAQTGFGQPRRRLRKKKPNSFLAIIGEKRDFSAAGHHLNAVIRENLYTIIKQKLPDPYRENRSTPMDWWRKINIYEDIFDELVQEVIMDPYFYRMAEKQSVVLDFSATSARGDWSNVRFYTSKFPLQKDEYVDPIIAQIKNRIIKRLVDRYTRKYISEVERKMALGGVSTDGSKTPKFQNPEIVDKIWNAERVMVKTHRLNGQKVRIAVTGLEESEYDIRNGMEHDIFFELQKALGDNLLERVGSFLLSISSDANGNESFRVTLDKPNTTNHRLLREKIRFFLKGYLETVVASDTHWGGGKFTRNRRRVEAFEHMLENVVRKRSTLILLGDIIDFIRNSDLEEILKNPKMERIRELLQQVRRIIYIEGNHDWPITGNELQENFESSTFRLSAYYNYNRSRGGIDKILAIIILKPLIKILKFFKNRRRAIFNSPLIQKILVDPDSGLFKNMHLAPYYIDLKRGRIFEHGHIPTRTQVPSQMVVPFLKITRFLISSKRRFDRFIFGKFGALIRSWFRKVDLISLKTPIVRSIRNLIYFHFGWYFPTFFHPEKGPFRALLRYWLNLNMDLENFFQNLYEFLRIYVWPGPLMNGRLGIIEDRVLLPANRAYILGKLGFYLSKGEMKNWKIVNGHKHMINEEGKGEINKILRNITYHEITHSIIERDGQNVDFQNLAIKDLPVPSFRYINCGHWSEDTFLELLEEAVFSPSRILPETLPPPLRTRTDIVGSILLFPALEQKRTKEDMTRPSSKIVLFRTLEKNPEI